MNPKVPQFENDSDLLKAINDFLDNLESIGVEADLDSDKDGNLDVKYFKQSSLAIKNKKLRKAKTT